MTSTAPERHRGPVLSGIAVQSRVIMALQLPIPIMNTTIEAEKSGGGRLCFWLGIAAYLTSFFLPSINRMAGWECATQSLSVLFLPGALLIHLA